MVDFFPNNVTGSWGDGTAAPLKLFVRNHEAYYVSLNALQAMKTKEIQLENKLLPLSGAYMDKVVDSINRRVIKR